jgi:hypothetical protein
MKLQVTAPVAVVVFSLLAGSCAENPAGPASGDVPPIVDSGGGSGCMMGVHLPELDSVCVGKTGCTIIDQIPACGCTCAMCDGEKCVRSGCGNDCPDTGPSRPDAGSDVGPDGGQDGGWDGDWDGNQDAEGDGSDDGGHDGGGDWFGDTGAPDSSFDAGDFDTGWGYFPKAIGTWNDDHVFSVKQTSDDGFILAGKTDNSPATDADGWLVKLNAEAGIEWQKTFGGDKEDYFVSVVATPDNGFLLAGMTASYGAGGDDLWLVKTDEAGDIEWQKAIGSVYEEWARDLKRTQDGGFVVLASTLNLADNDQRIWLVRLDPDGEILWQSMPGQGLGWSVDELADGRFLLTGFSAFGEIWLFSVNASGRLESSDGVDSCFRIDECAGGFDFSFATSFLVVLSLTNPWWDDYLVAGHTNCIGAGGFDLVLTRTNTWGIPRSFLTYGGAWDDGVKSKGNSFLLSPVLLLPADEGYVLAGSVSSFGAGAMDFWVTRFDQWDQIIWQRTYGGSGDEFLQAATPTRDGGYILAGTTTSFGAGRTDAWIVKIGADGRVWGTCPEGIGRETDAQPADHLVEAQSSYPSDLTTEYGVGVSGAVSRLGSAWSRSQCSVPPEWECVVAGDPTGCGANATCVQNACKCEFGHLDCDFTWLTGCEVDSDTDAENCGLCGNRCAPLNVLNALCVGSECGYDSCMPGFADKDGDRSNGCEMGTGFPMTLEADFWSGSSAGLAATGDGGFVFVDDFDYTLRLIKFGADGVAEWEKRYSDTDYLTGGSAAVATPDGGLLVVGNRRVRGGAQDSDILAAKLDGNGTIEWQKAYGGAGWFDLPRVVASAGGGYLLITGRFLLKLDATGQAAWQERFLATPDYVGVGDVIAVRGGGYLVTGGYSYNQQRSEDAFLMKLDDNGGIAWQYRYGGASYSGAASAVETPDGGFLVLLNRANSDFTMTSLSLLKVTSEGSPVSVRNLRSSDWFPDYFLRPTGDGGALLLCGAAGVQSAEDDIWAVRLDPGGTLLWQQAFGGLDFEWVFDAVELAGGELMIAGFTGSYGPDPALLFRLSPDGELASTCDPRFDNATSFSGSASTASVSVSSAVVEAMTPEPLEVSLVAAPAVSRNTLHCRAK